MGYERIDIDRLVAANYTTSARRKSIESPLQIACFAVCVDMWRICVFHRALPREVRFG